MVRFCAGGRVMDAKAVEKGRDVFRVCEDLDLRIGEVDFGFRMVEVESWIRFIWRGLLLLGEDWYIVYICEWRNKMKIEEGSGE